MLTSMAAAARRAEDWAADHARAVAVLLVLASMWGRIPGTVILNAPAWLAVTAFIAVIVVAFALLGVEIYKVNVFAESWDQVVDDSDRGARGVERHDVELDEIRHHLASADTDEMPAAQPAPRPRPTPRPRTQPAVDVLAEPADEWRKRFTFVEGGRR